MLACLVLAGYAVAQDVKPTRHFSSQESKEILSGIARAYESGERRFALPEGVYSVPVMGEEVHLDFRGMKDIEIDASGSVLVFEDVDKTFIGFAACSGVTFRGAEIRSAKLGFSQAAVCNVDKDFKYIDIRVCQGYSDDFLKPFKDYATFWLFEGQSRRWKPGKPDLGVKRVEALQDRLWRLHFVDYESYAGCVELGDQVAFGIRRGHALCVKGCERMKFSGLAILGSNSGAMLEVGVAGGNEYSSITVSYGSKPDGADVEPLLSALADAFHSALTRQDLFYTNLQS